MSNTTHRRGGVKNIVPNGIGLVAVQTKLNFETLT